MICERIKEARIKKNMTQVELAEKTGITQTAVCAFENGLKVPSVATIVIIANELDVSIDWLTERSEKEK